MKEPVKKTRHPVRVYIIRMALLTGIVLGILGLARWIQSFMLSESVRYSCSRVQVDLRALATALEAYATDHENQYPAWARGAEGANFRLTGSAAYQVPTFRIWRRPGDRFDTLTTPVAYISTLFKDGFVPTPQATYAYWVLPTGKGWIMWSPGPDGRYDIVPATDYDLSRPIPSPALLNHTYDPSNGTASPGDVYRVKQ